jgi:hypothetical protein
MSGFDGFPLYRRGFADALAQTAREFGGAVTVAGLLEMAEQEPIGNPCKAT